MQLFIYIRREGANVSSISVSGINESSKPICVSASGTTNRGLYSYFISSQRKLTVKISGNICGESLVEAVAYRRIGSNV